MVLWPEVEPTPPALKAWRCLDIIWAKQPDSLSQYQWSTPNHPCYFPWHFPMSKNLAQKKYRVLSKGRVRASSLRALKLGLEDCTCSEWEMGFTESPDKFWGNQDLDMEYRGLCRETREELIRKEISGYYIPSTVLWTQRTVMIKIVSIAVLKRILFNRLEAIPSSPLSPERYSDKEDISLPSLQGELFCTWRDNIYICCQWSIRQWTVYDNMGYMEWLRHLYKWNTISQGPNFYCLLCLNSAQTP